MLIAFMSNIVLNIVLSSCTLATDPPEDFSVRRATQNGKTNFKSRNTLGDYYWHTPEIVVLVQSDSQSLWIVCPVDYSYREILVFQNFYK